MIINQKIIGNFPKLTIRPVHLHARYIQKQATLSDENLTQKSVSIRLLVAVRYAASAKSLGAFII